MAEQCCPRAYFANAANVDDATMLGCLMGDGKPCPDPRWCTMTGKCIPRADETIKKDASCGGRQNGTFCVGPYYAPFLQLNHTLLECPSGKLTTCPSGFYCDNDGTGDPVDKSTCQPM